MDWSPILISMKTASLSIFITFFLGIFAAWAVVSMKNETWKLIWDGVLTLPLVLPPTVAGFFLLYMFGVKRPVGQFFIEYFSVKIAFSWTATVIAAVVMSFPLMYRSARGAFEQVDQNLVAAARTLGMSEWGHLLEGAHDRRPAGGCQRRRPGICKGTGRIWGHCHDCGKHSRQNKDPSHGGLFRGGRRQYGYGVPLCGGYCGHRIPVHYIDELGSIKAREPEGMKGEQP